MKKPTQGITSATLSSANLAKHDTTLEVAASDSQTGMPSSSGAGPNPFQTVLIGPPSAVEVPKEPTVVSMCESVHSAQKAHASARQIASMMTAHLKPALEAVQARASSGSSTPIRSAVKAPRKKRREATPSESSSAGEASDDVFLGTSSQWEKDKVAEIRQKAANATRKLLNTNFWERAAVGMVQVITGHGNLLVPYLTEEDLPEAHEEEAQEDMLP